MPSKPTSPSSIPAADRPGRGAPRRRATDAVGDAAAEVPWPLRPLRWLQSVLRRPLRLERRGLQIHVVLAPPAEAPAAAASPPETAPGRGEALRQAHLALRALLDHHPRARRTMRHLAYLERALARRGSRAVTQEVPVPVLMKCLDQLDVLVRDQPAAGIAELRRQLRAAIGARAQENHGFALSQPVHVSEASHSLFDEMARSWTGQVTPAQPPAKPKRE